MKLAKVNFYKDVEQDHYENGVTGQLSNIHSERLTFEFETEQDLLNQFATWIEARYDISTEEYLAYVHNECDHYRFDFNQNEDSNGFQRELNKNYPTGYLTHYQMLVTDVLEIKQLDYKFELKESN